MSKEEDIRDRILRFTLEEGGSTSEMDLAIQLYRPRTGRTSANLYHEIRLCRADLERMNLSACRVLKGERSWGVTANGHTAEFLRRGGHAAVERNFKEKEALEKELMETTITTSRQAIHVSWWSLGIAVISAILAAIAIIVNA